MDIEYLLSDKTKKIGVVMAHCDDESLFLGGILSKFANKNWKLVTCCLPYNAGDEDWKREMVRINYCSEVHKKLNLGGWEFLSFPGVRLYEDRSKVENLYSAVLLGNIPSLNVILIKKLIDFDFDVIITHNCFGEYGAPWHTFVHNAVKTYKGLINNLVEVFTIAMHREGIRDNPDYVLKLDDELYNKKIDLIDTYKGKAGTLKKYGLVDKRKEALWYESH